MGPHPTSSASPEGGTTPHSDSEEAIAERRATVETENAMGINHVWRERRRREAQRRRFGAFPGNDHDQRRLALQHALVQLRGKLSSELQPTLLAYVSAFAQGASSAKEFAQQLQGLSDAEQIIVTHDYVPQRHYATSSAEPVGKRSGRGHDAGGDSTKVASTGRGTKSGARPKKSKGRDSPRSPMGTSMPGSPAAAVAASNARKAAAGVCPGCEKEPLVDDHRRVCCDMCGRSFHQVCGMYNPSLGSPFFCATAGCVSARRNLRPTPYVAEDLQATALGDHLTRCAQASIEDGADIVVKVVSDKDVFKQLPEGSQHHCSSSTGQGTWCSYRCKAILAFRRFRASGAQVVFFGMYVHEYGPSAPASTAGRVLVENIDSTPLHAEEKGAQRQDVLTAIIHGYLEYVASEGFTFVHVRIPPPTDENGHIFTSRSVHVRLRAAMHLAHWFKRLLNKGKAQGVIADFASAPHASMANFPPTLLEPGHVAADIAFRYAGEDGTAPHWADAVEQGHQQPSAALAERLATVKDRFFIVSLNRGGDVGHAMRQRIEASSVSLQSNLAGARADLVALIHGEQYSFHTLQHNRHSTMLLVHHLVEEQRAISARARTGLHIKPDPYGDLSLRSARAGPRGYAGTPAGYMHRAPLIGQQGEDVQNLHWAAGEEAHMDMMSQAHHGVRSGERPPLATRSGERPPFHGAGMQGVHMAGHGQAAHLPTSLHGALRDGRGIPMGLGGGDYGVGADMAEEGMERTGMVLDDAGAPWDQSMTRVDMTGLGEGDDTLMLDQAINLEAGAQHAMEHHGLELGGWDLEDAHSAEHASMHQNHSHTGDASSMQHDDENSDWAALCRM